MTRAPEPYRGLAAYFRSMSNSRSVERVLPSLQTLEGAGFLVHRPFPTSVLDQFDPFLLLDEMGPMDLAPGEAKGAPDHPHRGFETVTYLLSGEMEHRDSRGNHGRLTPGDVQWMTAGSGVVHSEMPAADFQSRGGRMHGFQLWVNLPRRDKMMAPRYQEIPAAKIPTARSADGGVTVRVIAGEALGQKAVIDTRTPIVYLDVRLEKGASFSQPVDPALRAFVYVVEGSGAFGSDSNRQPAGAHQLVLFQDDGDAIQLEATGASPLRVLLIAGQPLHEPVARAGPFVMNSRAEVIQAFDDFQNGRLGKVAGMPVRQVLKSRVPVKVWTAELEESARKQLLQTGELPFVFRHVAAMADTHWGMGATVGSVMATEGAICPAAVGVDIGCGMAAVKTGLDASSLEGKLPGIRHSIERSIPVGFHQRREPHPDAAELLARSGPSVATESERRKAALQCGTLGGGNHFIEICVDLDDDRVWVLLHSGSRNIGKVTAERHIDRAKDRNRKSGVSLPNPDLAYVSEGSPAFDSYIADLQWCQDFALTNRRIMLAEVLKDLRLAVGVADLALEEPIHCHHNYVAWERHFGRDVMVTRKGAIRARQGDLGIIPGSMGTGSFVVRGLGNPESFESAPHGAGRRMSRGAARRAFTREDLAAQTAGVECRKDAGVIDEIPSAYKPIGEVLANSSDLVEVVSRLKQVVCVKG